MQWIELNLNWIELNWKLVFCGLGGLNAECSFLVLAIQRSSGMLSRHEFPAKKYFPPRVSRLFIPTPSRGGRAAFAASYDICSITASSPAENYRRAERWMIEWSNVSIMEQFKHKICARQPRKHRSKLLERAEASCDRRLTTASFVHCDSIAAE
jgi:hypothetical protein